MFHMRFYVTINKDKCYNKKGLLWNQSSYNIKKQIVETRRTFCYNMYVFVIIWKYML